MTPDNPFLKALLTDPEDDTLRLAMADWLDENGDATRAEFIRTQIELARGVANRARRIELEARQSKLLFAHDAEWVAPLAEVLRCKPGEWGGWVFRRGFVEYFRLKARTVLTHGFRLVQLTPVRELYLEADTGVLAELWSQPWVRSLTHVYEIRVTEAVAEAMISSPHLSNLRYLYVLHGEMSSSVARRFRERFASVMPV